MLLGLENSNIDENLGFQCFRPLLENSESSYSQPTYGERATKLLHGLETHSVLFVLHRSTQLATLESQEVLRLLQNVAKGSGGKLGFFRVFSSSFFPFLCILLLLAWEETKWLADCHYTRVTDLGINTYRTICLW